MHWSKCRPFYVMVENMSVENVSVKNMSVEKMSIEKTSIKKHPGAPIINI